MNGTTPNGAGARFHVRARLVFASLFFAAAAGRAQTPSPTPSPTPTPAAQKVQEQVVVSATKIEEPTVDVPNSVSVVSGEELRRRGTRTLADALQDVVGIDTGNGSDNGPRQPNIGVYGVKEFDALQVNLDGVPVGGPFNPNLAMIPIEDIDRIEILRGPQSTLYGVSAFAGMVNVYTRSDTGGTTWGSARVGGFGQFKQGYGDVNLGTKISPDFTLRINGSIARGDGWQDRTDLARDQLRVSLENTFGQTKVNTSLLWLRDSNFWGSPTPVEGETGEIIEPFQIDENYAVGGARVDHHIVGLFNTILTPLGAGVEFENVLGVTHDSSGQIRSWINEIDAEGNQATAEGISLYPKETVVYDDAHARFHFEAAGEHHLVAGAALTWGKTTAEGHGFDFAIQIDPVVVPAYGTFPFGDNRNFEDRRTFFGIYLNDEWTPVQWFTLAFGGRYDLTSESLHVFQQEVGDPNFDTVDDSRHDNKPSWGVSGLFRLVDQPSGPLTAINLYGAARRNFKPAAPNLTEAENAHILNPETTNIQEAGLKTRWLDGALSVNVTWFHMIFQNLVVGVLGPDGPELVNAGAERFQGTEIEAGYTMPFLEGLSVYGGYAHHDARYKDFTFINEEGGEEDAAGRRIELVPRDTWNLKLVMAPKQGVGGFIAVRHQNHRVFDIDNFAYAESFFMVDAGLSFDFDRFRVAVIGRNLSDQRPFVAESEIGADQFFAAPPRGVSAELTVRF
jgi:outer membrane receptor protein involved in Fe transport